MVDRTAGMKARADAFARLAGPPYNLSKFESIAKQMKENVKKQEAKQASGQSWEDVCRSVLEEHGKDALPRPDDFYLCFYLEADKDDPHARELRSASDAEPFLAEPFPCLTEESILKATVVENPDRGAPRIDVTLTEGGGKLFAEVTRKSIGKRMAIVVDDNVVSAPVIRSSIPGGKAMIAGDFSRQEADAIAEKLNAYRKEAREFLDNLEEDMQGVSKPKTEPRPSRRPPSTVNSREKARRD